MRTSTNDSKRNTQEDIKLKKEDMVLSSRDLDTETDLNYILDDTENLKSDTSSIFNGYEEDEPFKGFNSISREVDEAMVKEEPFKGFNNISDEIDKAIEIENRREMDSIFGFQMDEDAYPKHGVEELFNDEEDLVDDGEETTKGNGFDVKATAIGLAVCIAIALIGLFGYKVFYYDRSISSFETLQERVAALYTNDKKEDIRHNISEEIVNTYIVKLDELGVSEEDKKPMDEELSTILSYIADRDMIYSIEDVDYDYNNTSTKDNIDKVKESTKSYTVAPLTVTMNDKVSKVEEDYNYYINLRNELSVVKDYLNFDYEGYQVKVNEVNHKVNKKELRDMLDELYKAKKKAEEVEKLKEKATEEALKQAEELQKETEKSLQEAKEELNTYKEDTKSFIDSLLNGKEDKLTTSTTDETSEQGSEENANQ